jgi:hypothetical protein
VVSGCIDSFGFLDFEEIDTDIQMDLMAFSVLSGAISSLDDLIQVNIWEIGRDVRLQGQAAPQSSLPWFGTPEDHGISESQSTTKDAISRFSNCAWF